MVAPLFNHSLVVRSFGDGMHLDRSYGVLGLNVNQSFFRKEVKDVQNFIVLNASQVVHENKDSFYEFIYLVLPN